MNYTQSTIKKWLLSCAAIALFAVFSKAADVNFTIYHQLDNISGYIVAEVDPAITSTPFLVTIEGTTNGYFDQFTTSDLTILFPGLASGDYCVTIEDVNGCTISKCMNIRRCITWKGRIMCLAIAETPKEVAFVMANPPSTGVLADVDYSITTTMEFEKLTPMVDHLFADSDIELEKLMTTGESDYLVSEQDEVETDAEYVFKFLADGSLEWVYHQEKEETKEREGVVEEVATINSTSTVYPNPFTGELTLLTEVAESGELVIDFHDIVGKKWKTYSFEVIAGKNTLSLNGLEDIPAGLYHIVQYNSAGERRTHKVMKLE